MQVKYKIYEVIPVTYDTIPDGYYYKDLVRYELRKYDKWNDSFDTEAECVEEIENSGEPGTTYTIQKEYYIPRDWEKDDI